MRNHVMQQQFFNWLKISQPVIMTHKVFFFSKSRLWRGLSEMLWLPCLEEHMWRCLRADWADLFSCPPPRLLSLLFVQEKKLPGNVWLEKHVAILRSVVHIDCVILIYESQWSPMALCCCLSASRHHLFVHVRHFDRPRPRTWTPRTAENFLFSLYCLKELRARFFFSTFVWLRKRQQLLTRVSLSERWSSRVTGGVAETLKEGEQYSRQRQQQFLSLWLLFDQAKKKALAWLYNVKLWY